MKPTFQEIIADVAQKMKVDPADIVSAKRDKRIVIARWECWKRLAAIGWSSTRIAQKWGRDHSTVVHGVQKMGGKFNRSRMKPEPKGDEDEVRRAMMIQAYWAARGVQVKTRFEAFEVHDRKSPAVRSDGIPIRER